MRAVGFALLRYGLLFASIAISGIIGRQWGHGAQWVATGQAIALAGYVAATWWQHIEKRGAHDREIKRLAARLLHEPTEFPPPFITSKNTRTVEFNTVDPKNGRESRA